jgi:hypothetical protein
VIRNIRNRFPAARWMRIVGWTTVTMAWITAVITRVAAAAPAEPVVVPDQAGVVTATSVPEAMPLLPGQGLVVLRSTPSPTPEPEVVVTAPAGGTAPTASVSSGS